MKLVERSAKEINSLKLILAAVFVLGSVALFALHQTGILKFDVGNLAPAKTVEGREFGFYNQHGTRVFLIDKDKFGYPNLILMDLKKQYKMGIMVFADGGGTPGLAFYDSSGLRGHLRMNGDQASVLKLTGAKEKGSISLSVSAGGDPSLIITDKAGKVMFAVPEGASEPKPPEPMRPGIMPGSSDPLRGPEGRG
jgi:hypothetical protein